MIKKCKSYPATEENLREGLREFPVEIEGGRLQFHNGSRTVIVHFSDFGWEQPGFYSDIIVPLATRAACGGWLQAIVRPSLAHYFKFYGCYPVIFSSDISQESDYRRLIEYPMGPSDPDRMLYNWATIAIVS